MKTILKPTLPLILFLLVSPLLVNAQTDDQAIAEKIVNFCTLNHKKKVGRGQCTDLIFTACSRMDRSLYNDTRKIDFKKEALKPGDIIHLEWKEFFKHKQHYMIVIEVIDGVKVKIAHQNFNNQLKVVYTNYNLTYEEKEKKRKVTVYRMVNKNER